MEYYNILDTVVLTTYSLHFRLINIFLLQSTCNNTINCIIHVSSCEIVLHVCINLCQDSICVIIQYYTYILYIMYL